MGILPGFVKYRGAQLIETIKQFSNNGFMNTGYLFVYLKKITCKFEPWMNIMDMFRESCAHLLRAFHILPDNFLISTYNILVS